MKKNACISVHLPHNPTIDCYNVLLSFVPTTLSWVGSLSSNEELELHLLLITVDLTSDGSTFFYVLWAALSFIANDSNTQQEHLSYPMHTEQLSFAPICKISPQS